MIARAAVRQLGLDRRTLAQGALRTAARGLQAPRSPVETPAGALSTVALVVWLGAVACFLLVVVNADLLLPDDARDVFRVVVGAVLVTAGCGSLARRLAARELLIRRLAGGASRRARRRLLGAIVTLFGFAFLGLGVFDLARGAAALAGS